MYINENIPFRLLRLLKGFFQFSDGLTLSQSLTLKTNNFKI